MSEKQWEPEWPKSEAAPDGKRDWAQIVRDYRRRAAEAENYEDAKEVALPSGLPMMIRRPLARAFAVEMAAIPQTLAARISPEPSAGAVDRDRVTADALAIWRVLQKAVIAPKLTFTPSAADELDPRLLLEPDRQFLNAYIRGEVDADGANLDRFHPERTRSADSGGGGGAVSLPAVRDAARAG
jgi:hypothetical protein